MQNAISTLSNVNDCIDTFKAIRRDMVDAMVRLAAVFAAKSWESKASSWGEFVESELQISQSSASKLLRVHEAYLISGTTKPAQLEGVDVEKLYLAIPLLKEQSPKQVIATAKELSRSELKAEMASNGSEECKHEHQVTICSSCHARV